MNYKNKLVLEQINGLRTVGYDFSRWEKLDSTEKLLLAPYACGSFDAKSLQKLKVEGFEFNEICLGFAVNNTLECFKLVKEYANCKLTKAVFVNIMIGNKIEYLECFGEEVKQFLDCYVAAKEGIFIQAIFSEDKFFGELYLRNFISGKFVHFLEERFSLSDQDKKNLLRLKLMTID